MTKPTPQVDDEDVDRFTKLNPALTAEERADVIHDFVIDYVELTEPDRSTPWVEEFARRVRARALWLKPLSGPSATKKRG